MADAGHPDAGKTPRTGLKNRGALLLGKVLIGTARLLKHGGTTLPGRAALKVSPQLPSFLAGQLTCGTIAVTGTNGKTTTAALLAAILKESGRRYVHNSAGANLAWGVATALIEAGTLSGRMPAELALLEIDEGAFPAISECLRPRCAIITNIFKDQLDRFGGVRQVQKAIQKGVQALHPGAQVCLNADDPLVAAINSKGRKTLYYGFDLPAGAVSGPPSVEKTPCPLCGRELIYTDVYYAHLGRYRCHYCSFRRPEPEIKLRHFEIAPGNNILIKLSLRGSILEAVLPLPGTYNLYNALAAAAASTALDLPETAIRTAFAGAAPPAGRMEHRLIENKELLLALIKNPAGANETFRTLLKDAKGAAVHFLIAINDHIADGKDISWLGETDFEQLTAIRPGSTFISGTRTRETLQRLEKAGFEPGAMFPTPSLQKALPKALAATAPGEKLVILANYTAMMRLRRMLTGI